MKLTDCTLSSLLHGGAARCSLACASTVAYAPGQQHRGDRRFALDRGQGHRQGHAEGGAGQPAGGIQRDQSAAHRVRLSQHRQCAGPQRPGRERRRSAQHQRGAGGRPHAPGAQPRPRRGYDTQIDGRTLLITLQGAAAAASPVRRHHPFRGTARRRSAAMRCATSTSAAAPPAKAASSSICRTAASASTSSSRAAPSSSISSIPRCPRTCAAAWT